MLEFLMTKKISHLVKLQSKTLIGFFLPCLVLGLCACRPSPRDLLEKADADALDQRALVSKYIYLQLIKDHPNRDEIRYRAMKGLVNISLTQTYEYPVAVGTMHKLIEEFENEAQFRSEIPDWRRRLSEVYRVNLQTPRKAMEVLHPILNRTDLSEDIDEEMGQTFIALSQYSEAEISLKRAWEKAQKLQRCGALSRVQLDLIQTYSLSRRCDRAIEWVDRKLPEGCVSDRFALGLEKANCLEMGGDSSAAVKIYEDLLKQNPKNLRAQYLLENIKRRERRKEIK